MKWLLRLSKAILNLSVQDVGAGILRAVLDQKAMLTLTLEVRMPWCLVDQEDKMSCFVSWEDVGCWHSAQGIPAWAPLAGSLNTAAKLLMVLIPSVTKWERRSRLCIMWTLKVCYPAVVYLVGWDFRSNWKSLKISRKSIIELWAIESIALVTLTNLCFPKYLTWRNENASRLTANCS